MNTRFAAALLLALVPLGAIGADARQSAPEPTPSPIVVPTLAPATNTLTDQLIRAAIGTAGGIISRNLAAKANGTHGVVSYYKRFDMQVRTGQNSYRTVHLHPGTVINPRGATPGAGTTVDVAGNALDDGSLDAFTITVLQ